MLQHTTRLIPIVHLRLRKHYLPGTDQRRCEAKHCEFAEVPLRSELAVMSALSEVIHIPAEPAPVATSPYRGDRPVCRPISKRRPCLQVDLLRKTRNYYGWMSQIGEERDFCRHRKGGELYPRLSRRAAKSHAEMCTMVTRDSLTKVCGCTKSFTPQK
jgi:hypothetical protein